MRVSKEQLVSGVMDYIETEVIPQVEDKPTQIVVSIAVNYIRANPSIVDKILAIPMVQMVLDKNDKGYEISSIFSAIEDSVRKYGGFPITIPPVPIISPVEKTLTFSESDISEMKRRIERSAMNG